MYANFLSDEGPEGVEAAYGTRLRRLTALKDRYDPGYGRVLGTWFSLSRTMDRLSPETFVAVGHQMIRNLGGPMAVLLPLALLSALVTLVLMRREGHAQAFWWLLAGFGLMVAALVITLAVEVPIDNRIETWTAATLPAGWRSVQARWELWHTIRTLASIAVLVAVSIGAAVTGRPDRPAVGELGPRPGAVAGGRSA